MPAKDKGCLIPRDRSYRLLWYTLWVLGIKPGSFRRSASALNCWAASPAPNHACILVFACKMKRLFCRPAKHEDRLVWTECENNHHPYGTHSVFSLLSLSYLLFNPEFHLRGPGEAERGCCRGVIASLSYRSWRFKEEIKEVCVICQHRPDRELSEAFGLDVALCVSAVTLCVHS